MKKALAPASKQTQGQPMWGRGHCTTAHFFLQGEAALCKASPFTTKPARVGKPSPRRSPWQTSTSQREGGTPFPGESPGFYTRRPPPVPGALSWASTGWGDTVVTKSFLCAWFCTLWAAHTMPTNPFFMSAFFDVSGAARGFSWLGVSVPSHAG